MEKNEIITVTGEALGTSGEGIAKYGGTTVFVRFLLPGERADVKILKVSGNIAYAAIEELLTPAEERVRPVCPAFRRCGGCQLQHLRYREQLAFKTGLVRDTLKKIGGISFPVSACVRSEKEYGYRNKLQLPVGRRDGKNVVGFYAERSHRIIPTSACPIHPAWAEKIIAALLNFMEKCGLDGYDEQTHRGHVRHIIVRELKRRFLVTLVVTDRDIKGIDYFLHLLGKIFPEFSLYLNVNDRDTNVVLGEEFVLVSGKGTYECSEGGILYEAGANTFVQVNDGVRAKLYERIVSLAEEGTAVDCYAGGGLLTAMLAQKCGTAYGIEVVPEASACADALMRKNDLCGKMHNICGAVEEEFAGVLAREKDATVVLDPPRAGVKRSVIGELLRAKPKRIIMVSCNPATLARDLGLLVGTLTETETGELVKSADPHTMYEIESVEPFDMFPQSRWVETVVSLSRRG